MNYDFLINEFTYIAKNMSISAAARELNTTQSALSKRLDALEKELGCTLIERKKGAMKCSAVTESGQIILDAACSVSHTLSTALAEVARTKTRNKQILAVGSSLKYLVRSSIGQLSEKLATERSIVVRFDDEIERIPFEMLREKTLDIAIEPFSTKADAHSLLSVPLGLMPTVFVFHENNPLAQRSSVSLMELDDLGAITRASQADYSLRKHLHALWENHGKEPYFLIKSGESLSAVAFKHLRPETFMLVPALYRDYLSATVPFARFVPIEEEDSALDIRLFFRNEPNAEVEAFVNLATSLEDCFY